jgi:ferric-dicitrate binding protein FerR (iron transport regulator)
MPVPERAHELIQKYLDELATDAELAELEGLLAGDPEVATAFADAARLQVGLQDYFQKQYKIDQVAALLDLPEDAPAPATGEPEGKVVEPPAPDHQTREPLPAGSAYVPIFARLERARRSRHVARTTFGSREWKWIAAVAVVVMLGLTIWSLQGPTVEPARLISGRVAVAGRDVSQIPGNRTFEVVGNEPAVIELPGGARLNLDAKTRAAVRRDKGQLRVQLESGGGEFHVAAGQAPLEVETPLGVVTAAESQFSLDLLTKLPVAFSPTAPLAVPRLKVTVAQGAVSIKHGDVTTKLTAGQEQVFL